ncbi:MAG: hypothetical protein DWQ34_24565 [Planctomycetota bacterium]|nr:MAG: hypothetical protein DWQ34_24565 [Planctomycetota bacterium]
MLQSFIGRFDHSGLRSLRFEPDYEEERRFVGVVPGGFWAVVDSDELPTIHRALIAGQRQTALELIVDRARSVGRVCG